MARKLAAVAAVLMLACFTANAQDVKTVHWLSLRKSNASILPNPSDIS